MELHPNWWTCRCGGVLSQHVEKCPSCGFEKSSRQTFADVQPVDRESKLHNEIEIDLVRRRWPYIHSRMDKKSSTGRGTADFIIFAPVGRTIIIEAKARDEKQTEEQRIFQIMVENVGHKYHLIRSIEEYSQIIQATEYETRQGL